jgi:uncharacterized membrane protein
MAEEVVVNAKPVAVSAEEQNSRLMAALAWFFAPVSSIVFMVLENYKKDKLVQFYAWEGLAYFVAYFVLSSVLNVVTLGFASCLIFPVAVVIAFLGAFKAYNGEYWKLPVIGDWSEQQAAKAGGETPVKTV